MNFKCENSCKNNQENRRDYIANQMNRIIEGSGSQTVVPRPEVWTSSENLITSEAEGGGHQSVWTSSPGDSATHSSLRTSGLWKISLDTKHHHLHCNTPFTSGSLWVWIYPLDIVVRILRQSQGRLDLPQIRKGENKKSDHSKQEGRDLPV